MSLPGMSLICPATAFCGFRARPLGPVKRFLSLFLLRLTTKKKKKIGWNNVLLK